VEEAGDRYEILSPQRPWVAHTSILATSYLLIGSTFLHHIAIIRTSAAPAETWQQLLSLISSYVHVNRTLRVQHNKNVSYPYAIYSVCVPFVEYLLLLHGAGVQVCDHRPSVRRVLRPTLYTRYDKIRLQNGVLSAACTRAI
jgi:hypothetical protein